MKFLYNLGIWLYVGIIHLFASVNKKAGLWVSGRKDIFKQIAEKVDVNKKTAWFHASSLGEFEQARPVIEGFKAKYPNFKIVLTFFSPSGYEIQKNYKQADAVFYLPTDTKKNARKFISLVNPDVVFFVKYEFWYHYLYQLHKNNIPTYLFSAIFRKNQHFFKKYGKWYRKMLHFFIFIFVQNVESEKLLQSINISNVAIGGDTRFDRVWQIANNASDIDKVNKFCNNKTTIVAGSTWDKDEELLLDYAKTNADVKIIIAPHEVHQSNIRRIERLCENKCVKFSDSNETLLLQAQILIIDSIGLLSAIYRYAQIAYIGGGFGKGIHNTLEAAAYGIPVLFGSNYYKFQEAKDLISKHAGFSVNNEAELKAKINKLLGNEKYLNECKQNAFDYVKQMIGGTDLLLNKIELELK